MVRGVVGTWVVRGAKPADELPFLNSGEFTLSGQ
jgi:hypothetical protein